MKINLEKAIEILTLDIEQHDPIEAAYFLTALKLGVEALKWRKHCEDVGYVETCDLLPGETKD